MLVAISIPIFTTQLEKAREATDLANIRAAYAEAVTSALDSTDGKGSATSVALKSNGNFEYAGDAVIGGLTMQGQAVTKSAVTIAIEGTTVTFSGGINGTGKTNG